MLPDVVLLEIFDFYQICYMETAPTQLTGRWQTLVHVCRKWRIVVFGSPRRLDLRLPCLESTPVRETLDIWPRLPIVVVGTLKEESGVDNLVAVLEHNDRICELSLWNVLSSQLEKVLAAMQQPFPALTYLQLLNRQPEDETAAVVPASFLGGSVPRLQTLFLDRVPFPGLPKLLLSATHLVDLKLWGIPHSGYISPEAMVTCLSVLTRLERLDIRFKSPQSRPDRRLLRLPTRIVLPVLKGLWFNGVSEYLEDLVVRIDAPLLDKLTITFFHQLLFDTPRLSQFIARTPNFKTHDEARVLFSDWGVGVTLPQKLNRKLEVHILCKQPDWQLSSLAQVFSSSFPRDLIPAVEQLYILEDILSRPPWQDGIESSQWLELLHPFIAVKGLYLSQELPPLIAPTLQELVGERATEVLPALQTLFLTETLPSGPVPETIGKFVAERELAGYPITLSHWEGRY
jgi:hypothetical protein